MYLYVVEQQQGAAIEREISKKFFVSGLERKTAQLQTEQHDDY
jgi:hypothetical protein